MVALELDAGWGLIARVNILIDLKKAFDTVHHSILLKSYPIMEIKDLNFNGSTPSENNHLFTKGNGVESKIGSWGLGPPFVQGVFG